jgi:hypothetical protein
MLMGGRAGEADDTAKILYPDQPTRVRFFKLVRLVVEYMTLKQDGKIDGDKPIRTVIELEPDVHFAAKTIANDHRGPTGKRLGFAHWIEALILREVYRRYPHMNRGDAKRNTL